MRAVDLFELLASTTWHTILRANRNRIVFGEDAITSINLNAIVSLNDRSISVEDTRVDEAQRGCDFEMWIGSDQRGWSRYAIQAKKITVKSSRYEQLGHKVRGRAQIDILNAYAKHVRAAPLYCFYNFASRTRAWNCNLPPDAPQLGCMLTPLAVVQQALSVRRGSKNFDWMHAQPESIPWRCLFACPGHYRSKYPAHAPSRWLDPKDYYHKSLPEELQLLRKERRTFQLSDPTPLRYSEGQELYPRWTSIVDVDPKDEQISRER